jgi:hypothetical protein
MAKIGEIWIEIPIKIDGNPFPRPLSAHHKSSYFFLG